MNAKQKSPLVKSILSFLSEIGEMIPEPFETPYAYIRRAGHIEHKRYYDTVHKLRQRGALKVVKKNNQRFLLLTRKGQLELLLSKARIKKPVKWDGKWRLVIFDIPEDARGKRDQLRYLLKQNGFDKLQASVFISPYPLNRDSLAYLQSSKLINYIRMLRVDEMDNDNGLRKRFKLQIK